MAAITSTALGKLVSATQKTEAAKAAKDDVSKMILDGETKSRSKEQNTVSNTIKVNEEASKSFQF